jgi:hypothetical protein
MGGQIIFHFVNLDEREFNKFLAFKDVVFVKWDGSIFRGLTDYNLPDGYPFQLFIVRLSDIDNIKIWKEGIINLSDSPVIEFTRSYYDKEVNLLISGRLWFEKRYLTKSPDGRDILMEKGEALQKLYDSLAKWIKKYCERLPNGRYIGQHAKDYLEKGAKLSTD